MQTNSNTFKRLNITLSPETWHRLENFTSRMERSKFIDRALNTYLVGLKKRSLRQKLKKEALLCADSDLRENKEWLALDKEVWDNI